MTREWVSDLFFVYYCYFSVRSQVLQAALATKIPLLNVALHCPLLFIINEMRQFHAPSTLFSAIDIA